MATQSSTLAWKIPWMEEPGRPQSTGLLRVRHDWATSLSLFTFTHWRRKWRPTPVFLPGESQGQGSLVGCPMGSHRVGHDWSDLAAAVAAAGSSPTAVLSWRQPLCMAIPTPWGQLSSNDWLIKEYEDWPSCLKTDCERPLQLKSSPWGQLSGAFCPLLLFYTLS